MCCVHGTKIPRAAAHEHHEAPRAAGGGDEKSNLVWLCATCHQVAHRVGQLRQLNRGDEASDIMTSYYPAPAQRKRFAQVVHEMVTAHMHADLTGMGKPKAEVMLEIDHELYACLKQLALDYRSGGRRVGVAKYIEAVLNGHVIKNGMNPAAKKPPMRQ